MGESITLAVQSAGQTLAVLMGQALYRQTLKGLPHASQYADLFIVPTLFRGRNYMGG